jgi:hypothetical protein
MTLFAFLPTLCFRATRRWGAAGLFYASYFWGILVWIQCFRYVFSALGWGWVIFGVLLGGIGVVPIAWIASLINHDWGSLLFLSLNLAWVFGSRAIAFTCLAAHERRVEQERLVAR